LIQHRRHFSSLTSPVAPLEFHSYAPPANRKCGQNGLQFSGCSGWEKRWIHRTNTARAKEAVGGVGAVAGFDTLISIIWEKAPKKTDKFDIVYRGTSWMDGVGETRRDGRRAFEPCFLLFPIFVPSSPLGDMYYIQCRMDPSTY